MIFSRREVEYIKSQSIARFATAPGVGVSFANESGYNSSKIVQPDVVPVGFYFDGKYFHIGGFDMTRSTKYKNVLRNRSIALIIDDLKSVEPWQSRGIKIYGSAEIIKRQGASLKVPGNFVTVYSIKITPTRKWSWSIDDD